MKTASPPASPAVMFRMSHVAALAAWTVGLGAVAAWRWRQESAAA
jgi:hypothetical protein